MELISVATARSIWLFDLNDLNPGGRMIFPDLFGWLKEVYAFQTYPSSISDQGDGQENGKGYIFKSGRFVSGETDVMVNLSIYNDGVIAESWASTEISDLFVEQALYNVATHFDLSVPSTLIRKKLYISEVIVRMDNPFAQMDRGLSKFKQTLDRLFARHKLPPFELGGMSFMTDTVDSSYKAPGFAIERKMGTSFEDNRFWSKSPFTTTDHLNALSEFENTLQAL